jgi:dsDNA-binding SOS-regulon protein
VYPFDVIYCDILSMGPTDDYLKSKKGYDKLVIFVDSLTRWIEAAPINGDPSSEEVLGIFMELVVSRHGMPRTLRTDVGSHLTSRLCKLILEKTGTDLSDTEAYRHEGVGLVERAQQTLIAMVQAANEGGWVVRIIVR